MSRSLSFWQKLAEVEVKALCGEPHPVEYQHLDESAEPSGGYEYRVEEIEINGALGKTAGAEVPVAVRR